jgi:serine/threonine-protein kinase HipA
MEGRHQRAAVMYKDRRAGLIEEIPSGYRFTYEPEFLESGEAIAFSFPLRAEPFESEELFPFFQGLLPEGWYREIVTRTLKIDKKDLFGLLIEACEDCVGAVWIKAES